MLFFPLLNIYKNYQSSTTIYNFAPNSFEPSPKKTQFANISFTDGENWTTVCIDELKFGDFRKYSYEDCYSYIGKDSLYLISLSEKPINIIRSNLHKIEFDEHISNTPQWRASIFLGLKRSDAQTRYQGEVNLFPTKASLLTFGYMCEDNEDQDISLVLLNAEADAKQRLAKIKVYSIKTHDLVFESEICSNQANIISLNSIKSYFKEGVVFISNDMSGVPIFLKSNEENSFIEMEHTHPPASLITYGDRFHFQGWLKKNYFSIYD